MLPIQYNEFVAKLVKPGTDIHNSQDGFSCDLLHMAIGMSGESTELLAPVRSHAINGHKLNMTNIIEEIGDQEFFMEHARQLIGINRTSVLGGPLLVNKLHPYTVKLIDACVVNAMHCGDFLDAVKKFAIYNKPFNDCRPKMIDAMIGIETALYHVRDLVQVTRDTCLAANEGKLMQRYTKLTYSDAEAQARADKPQE